MKDNLDKEPKFEEIESSHSVTLGGVGQGHVQGRGRDGKSQAKNSERGLEKRAKNSRKGWGKPRKELGEGSWASSPLSAIPETPDKNAHHGSVKLVLTVSVQGCVKAISDESLYFFPLHFF